MKTHDDRIAQMIFATVYPLNLAKVEKKGRTKAELDQIISWLTGFTAKQLSDLVEAKANFETIFAQGPAKSSRFINYRIYLRLSGGRY